MSELIARALVFETPGLLDLKSLTMMGVSAKPNSNSPIGRFGTGLKYAVAVLTRLGTPPVIWIGSNRYEFVPRPEAFRGEPIELIDLVGPHDHRELPYTTAYGRNWEPWMVYRELEANTLDEGGRTYVTGGWGTPAPDDDKTRIVVISETLVACHENRDTVFLPDATRERGPSHADPEVEVFDRPSPYVYWRGLRVYTLPKPARRTYNLLVTMDLTEDRTLKHPFMADYYLKRHVNGTDDEKLVLDILSATRDEYEGTLVWDDSDALSETVVRVVNKAAAADSTVARTYLGRYVGEHLLKAAPKADPFARWPRPWRIEDWTVVDANDVRLLQLTDEITRQPDAQDILDLVIATVNRDASV